MSINWQEILFHFLGVWDSFNTVSRPWETVYNKLLEIAFVFTLINILVILSLGFWLGLE